MNSSHEKSHPALQDGLKHDAELPGNKFYTYDEFPNKVIRWEEGLRYSELVVYPYAKQLLETLEGTYDVPTSHTQFIVAGEGRPAHMRKPNFSKAIYSSHDLLLISDRIHDAVPVDAALEYADENAAIAYEFDALSTKLLRHLEDVLQYGGVYMSEYYRYHQYVFSPSADEGKRLVLVDTEPIHVRALEEPMQRIKGSVPAELLEILASCATDIISLENTSGYQSASRQKLLDIVDGIDSEGYEAVEQVKLAIRQALETTNPEVLSILDEEFDDGGEALLADVEEAAISVRNFHDRQQL